jgi:hypothetical protein
MLVVEPLVRALARAWRRAAQDAARRLAAAPTSAPVHDPEDPANWIGLDYVHDVALATLQQQLELWEEADGRLRLILGVIGIVFAVTLGLLPRGTVTVAGENGVTSSVPVLLPFAVGALAIAGLGLFALAGLVAVVAYWPRGFNGPPAPRGLRPYILTNERRIKLIVLDQVLNTYESNDVWLRRKLLAFRFALVIAAIATAVLGAGVMIQLAQLTLARS